MKHPSPRAPRRVFRSYVLTILLSAGVTLSGLSSPVLAQKRGAEPPVARQAAEPPPEKPAPYDAQLLRLAEILGSVHYLRTLCGVDSDEWRVSMQSLLDAETAHEPKRRERLTASFNRGYRAFAAVHTTCTPAARVAEERYRNEGATLSGEIAARYGN